jgi:hypothetical protein
MTLRRAGGPEVAASEHLALTNGPDLRLPVARGGGLADRMRERRHEPAHLLAGDRREHFLVCPSQRGGAQRTLDVGVVRRDRVGLLSGIVDDPVGR